MSLPRLSHQDYVFIADTIANAYLDPYFDSQKKIDAVRETIAEDFADALRGTNPAFDRDRFIAAATGQPLSRRDVQR